MHINSLAITARQFLNKCTAMPEKLPKVSTIYECDTTAARYCSHLYQHPSLATSKGTSSKKLLYSSFRESDNIDISVQPLKGLLQNSAHIQRSPWGIVSHLISSCRPHTLSDATTCKASAHCCPATPMRTSHPSHTWRAWFQFQVLPCIQKRGAQTQNRDNPTSPPPNSSTAHGLKKLDT